MSAWNRDEDPTRLSKLDPGREQPPREFVLCVPVRPRRSEESLEVVDCLEEGKKSGLVTSHYNDNFGKKWTNLETNRLWD